MAKPPKPRRAGSYIQKHEEWLSSPAYRDLSCAARCLLDEFLRVYRPGRNGTLSISQRNAASLLGVHKNTATKAFRELDDHGFLVLTQGQYWQEGKAREWHLTIEVHEGREPTDNWKHWTPKEAKAKSQPKARLRSVC